VVTAAAVFTTIIPALKVPRIKQQTHIRD